MTHHPVTRHTPAELSVIVLNTVTTVQVNS